jgi:hypothetical protein
VAVGRRALSSELLSCLNSTCRIGGLWAWFGAAVAIGVARVRERQIVISSSVLCNNSPLRPRPPFHSNLGSRCRLHPC